MTPEILAGKAFDLCEDAGIHGAVADYQNVFSFLVKGDYYLF